MITPVMPTYARAPLSFERGEGVWLVEQDGRRFLDLGGGIAVTSLGHAHPKLVEVLTEQAPRGWMVLNTPSRREKIMLLAASGIAPPE